MFPPTELPPIPAWLACDDCASTVRVHWPDPGRLLFLVDHSDTCPVWRDPEPEVALAMLSAEEMTR